MMPGAIDEAMFDVIFGFEARRRHTNTSAWDRSCAAARCPRR
jgi:hypothetical protein